MCDWDKNITCDCPELPLPWGLAVNEVKYDLREKERMGEGRACSHGAPGGSLPGRPEVWSPPSTVRPEKEERVLWRSTEKRKPEAVKV